MFLVRFCIKLVYVAYAILWWLFKYSKFKRRLEQDCKLTELKIVNFTKWRQGSFYFEGVIDTSKVFVKTDFWLGLIKNEQFCDELLGVAGGKHLISPLRFCRDDYAVYDYLDAITLEDYLLNAHVSAHDLLLVEQRIHEMLDLLYKCNIVHRDFTPRNVLVTKGNHLIAIDFFFANANFNLFSDIKDAGFLQRQLLKRLGIQKKMYLWDDAYSIVAGLKAIENQSKVDMAHMISSLEKKIGRLEYSYN